ncbi:nucleotidyltransferase family protein [Candidatus Parcubacteria bacterium]|nr:MAG: nucleotidyltransferase family protein [Candidatus Parcubacteria bacterium]
MQNRITQTVILSAGLGTRLRPHTDTMPKVMIPILGKPMLEWHVEQFKKHGVTEFFFNTHYLPDVIKNHFGDGSKWGVKIHYSFEPAILGTAGGVKQFEGKLNNEFFLIYGDTFSLVDYSKMVETWEKKPDDAIGMQRMKKTDDYADADVAEVGGDGLFLKIHAKPHVEKYANAYRMRGVFILKKKILSYVPPGTPYEIGKQLLPDIVKRGEKFYSYECGDYSKGIDTLEKWKEVEEHLKKTAAR